MKVATLVVLFLIGSFVTSFAQSDCKVKLTALEGNYNGDCKKGLAHGFGKAKGKDTYEGEFKKGLPHGTGIYTWSHGNVFDGRWNKGLKDGYGKLMIKTQVSDSLVIGYWQEDEYVGIHKDSYQIYSRTSGISGFRFVRDEKLATNGLEVQIQRNDNLQRNPEIRIDLVSGNYERLQPLNTSLQIINISTPFRARVRYMNEMIEVEVYQSGEWRMILEITEILGQGDGIRTGLSGQ